MPRQKQKGVEILYEDQDLLVVNKPAGLLSIPGRDLDEPSVVRMLQQRYPTLHIVHRLDRDTTGILVFTKNEESHRNLSLQFEERKVTKIYLALVVGRPPEQIFRIDAKLTTDNRGHAIVSSVGKPAVTLCKVLEMFPRFTLLEVQPLTGRQHQIRVHLAHIGLPLAVDPLYGSPHSLTISEIKPGARNANSDSEGPSSCLLSRTPLHALSLSVRHPVLGHHLQFTAELPKDMQATLRQLRKWSR